jgi:para-aminobenzoate synthetase/4-amino-4-deoxychorismate lyase
MSDSRQVKNSVGYVLAREPGSGCWLEFKNPVLILASSKVDEVSSIIEEAERLARLDNRWVVGWVSYDASSAFDRLPTRGVGDDLPLVWFGAFEEPGRLEDLPRPNGGSITSWWPLMGQDGYAEAFDRVHRHIAEGDTYQVNLSFRLKTFGVSNPYALFYSMQANQAGRYSFYIEANSHAVCCASPELFFEKSGKEIACRPMKGTAKRQEDSAADDAQATALAMSDKERAENVMIVDMIRNDLSRIANDASVQVKELFSVERYPGVLQMVSEVTAHTELSVADLLRCTFPAASITGAPKKSTMQVIKEVETYPRNLYTGSIGVFTPGDRCWFNVAIRTAVVDLLTKSAEYGAGSGVVWDSRRVNEYDECLLKARSTGLQIARPDLLETIRWSADSGFWLLDRHLARLSKSARYFGYPCDAAKIEAELLQSTELSRAAGRVLRFRLILNSLGCTRIEVSPYDSAVGNYTLSLATNSVDMNDPRLRHKTVDRSVYEQAVPSLPGASDVLLWNNRGEVTESRIANLVIQIGGELVTPALTSGVLPGCFREELVSTGQVKERIIKLDDLAGAEGFYMINSLRGMWPARLIIEGNQKDLCACARCYGNSDGGHSSI